MAAGFSNRASIADDADRSRYFMRIEIKADSLPFLLAEFRERFRTEVAEPLSMTWQINDSAVKKRVVVLVSKQEHCLYDLLARWQAEGTGHRDPLRHLQPRHLQGFRRVARHPVPSMCRSRRTTSRRPTPRSSAFSTTCAATPWCSPATCRSCRRELCEALSGQHHQHPPQLPAQLRRRQALPPGLHARRQADRRHLPLRDQRTRRRARSSSRT